MPDTQTDPKDQGQSQTQEQVQQQGRKINKLIFRPTVLTSPTREQTKQTHPVD